MTSTRKRRSPPRVPSRFALQNHATTSRLRNAGPADTTTATTTTATTATAPISLTKIRDQMRNATFSSLGLRKDVADAMQTLGFLIPSVCQTLATQPLLDGRNVLLAAETGSGKTMAYLAPIVNQLRQEEDAGLLRMDQRPRAVVIVPSRELVDQVHSMAKSLSHHVKFRAEAIRDRKPTCRGRLEGPFDLLVSTPQKFLYHVQNRTFSLADVRYLVVDEADTLMDKDFGEVLRGIRTTVREQSRHDVAQIFVSATIPRNLHAVVDADFGTDIVKVVTPHLHRTLPSLRQRFIQLTGHGDNKQRTLTKVLMELPPKDHPTLIFCNTLGSCRSLESHLATIPEAVDMCGGPNRLKAYHSRIPKETRTEILADFHRGSVSALICTDVASRGIDATNVGHVILYDFPYSAIDYLHRVGRTARAGREGKATSLVGKRDRVMAEQIQVAPIPYAHRAF